MSQKHHSPWSKTPLLHNLVLDIQVPRYIEKDNFDMIYTIDNKYDRRPDLLSYDLYGTAKYFWIFAARNPDVIFDPINDFVSGTEIRVPQKKNIQDMS